MEWFTGVIEDINDPMMMNRVRVRCFGIHTNNLSKIKLENLPWALVMLPTTSSGVNGLRQSTHGLLNGSWVVGFFRDGAGKQDPIIMGTVASTSLVGPDKTVGFNDPSGTYPKATHIKEPDVNRLARAGDKETDIPTLKTDSVTTEVPDALGATWSEPVTPYAPVYPFNTVNESLSGHVNEVDDTKGAERLHEYHKSGTFKEIHPDGTTVTRIKLDNYEIVYGNDFCNIQGNVALTINANCSTYIKGNWDVKVDGEVKHVFAKTLTTEVGGDVTETFSSNQTTKVSGNIDIDATRVDIN